MLRTRAVALLFLAACAAPTLPVERAETQVDPRPAIASVLDDLHAAASAAASARYFAHFAPGAIFYGTDATERWTLEDFREYAAPHFAAGKGWTYVATERAVYVDATGDTAWFDERLRNEKYGEVRGSGVLVRIDGAWKVTQYNLAFPVPNELAAELVERVRALAD